MLEEKSRKDNQDAAIFDSDPFELASRMLDESEELEKPEDFGRYHFLDGGPLGRGKLADVWLAEEQGNLAAERRVAIKFLRNVSKPDVAANEIKSQAKLEHKYIVRLYDYGLLDDETPWLAMEFVDGQPLDEYCHAKNCTIDERLRLFRAVAEAVQYAHSEKVDHGDLKPSNILVKADGEPKLLDFGLARRFYPGGEIAGQAPVLGFTPAYAAPEQFRGGSPGFRSDVYALGVILYQLLAGELPFDMSKHTYAEIESLKFGAEKPEAPSVAAKRRAGSAAANKAAGQLSKADWRDLDALCGKAMESEIDKRYASVESLLQDLDRYLKGEPLKARLPHSRGYQMGRFLKRNRSVVAAASLAFLVIAGMVTVFTLRLANERNKALAEAARTRRIQQFMLDLFGNGDPQAAPAKDLTVSAAVDRGAASVRSLSSDPETQAELYLTLGRLYEQLNQMPKAGELLQRGLDESKALGTDNTRTVRALIQLGILRGDEAQAAEAERLIREGLGVASRLHLSPDDPLVVNAQAELGKVFVQGGQYGKAVALLEPITRRPAASDEELVNLEESLNYLAVAQQYLGRYSVVESLNRRALELGRKLHGDTHPKVAEDLANIGTTEATLGHYAEAESLYRQAAGILEAWYGPDHPQTVQVKSFVGLTALEGGRNAEAEELFRNVLPVQERAYGTADHPNIAFTHGVLGKLAMARGDLAAAEAEFRRSVEILTKLNGATDYKTATTTTDLAEVFLKEGQYAQAERTERPAVKALTERPLPGNMTVGIAELVLGEALLKQRKYREAVEPLSAAHEVFKDGPPSIGKELPKVREDLMEVYEALHEPEKASIFRAEMGKAGAAK